MKHEEHLVLQWRWMPIPPPALATALSGTAYRDDAAFLGPELPLDTPEGAAFRFSFPTLSKQTPDLRFYRLIQIFNTPLLSLTTRDAGRSDFALWGGARPQFRDEFKWAHLWFFADQLDGDQISVEYGFEGGLTIRSQAKSPAELSTRYAAVCTRVSPS